MSRRYSPGIPRACDYCGTEYLAEHKELRRGWGLCCSRSCSRSMRRRNWPSCQVWARTCRECGSTFTAQRSSVWICSDQCRNQRQVKAVSDSIMRRYTRDPLFRDKVIAAAHARRADKLGLGSKQITIDYLGNRDGWQCGICRKPITHHGEASIDHIVPLSRGGQHELTNVHVAHAHCNQKKNVRAMNEQLILIG